MSYTVEGTIKEIYETQVFPSGFQKREFLVTTEGEYPQVLKFETIKEKTKMLDGLSAGIKVKVSFDIRGSEYKERYFVNLIAWKIECAGGTEAKPQMSPALEAAIAATTPADDIDEDVPF